jgi:hypothetical protein
MPPALNSFLIAVQVGDAPRTLGQVLDIAVRPRSNSRPLCSGCGRAGPGYDRLPKRRYAFVPLWALAVYFVYAPRRVACPRCGIKVEQLPWVEGKSRLTTTYRWFLASSTRVGKACIARCIICTSSGKPLP